MSTATGSPVENRPLGVVYQLLQNAGLSTWLAIDAIRSLLAAMEQTGLPRANGLLLAASLMVTAGFVFRRGQAAPGGISIRRKTIIIISLLLPFAYTPLRAVPDMIDPWLSVLTLIAAALMVWSTATLRSNFSIFPQVRQLVDSGPYGIVRHPLYASYLLLDLTYWVGSVDVAAGAIWAAEAGLLYFRAKWEEELWSGSPGHSDYCARVTYRFVPGVI